MESSDAGRVQWARSRAEGHDMSNGVSVSPTVHKGYFGQTGAGERVHFLPTLLGLNLRRIAPPGRLGKAPRGSKLMQTHRGRCPVRDLRHDLNGRPACRQIPQILQILIGESNTTVGPIARFVIVDWLGGSIRFSVNKDIPAGG